MRILYVDDEQSAHTIFAKTMEETQDVTYCFDYDTAIACGMAQQFDCGFFDVCLPKGNGISLAKALKEVQPDMEIAFITGYDQFAREAYQAEGRAYLTKPYATEELRKAILLMEKLTQPPQKAVGHKGATIFAKTFGNFDLLYEGVPVAFHHSKSKELLAYLIHQMGGSVTNDQVFFALWERQEFSNTMSTYVRRTVRALVEDLKQVGLESLILTHRNCVSVDMRNIVCDAHCLLEGDGAMAAKFAGAYMEQYPWGKSTIPVLEKAAARIQL